MVYSLISSEFHVVGSGHPYRSSDSEAVVCTNTRHIRPSRLQPPDDNSETNVNYVRKNDRFCREGSQKNKIYVSSDLEGRKRIKNNAR